MNEFGEFLYKLRKEKGMTQAELAELLGITNKAVSKWETGEAMPETAQLVPLSHIFGVTVDELLSGKFCKHSDKAERIENNLFTRGKNDEAKTFLQKIQGALCATVVFAGLLTFFILGILRNLWHPYWVLIPTCALFSGVIGVIFDLFDAQKRKNKKERGQNPLTGAVCGIIVLFSTITYLLLGAFLNLWHPLWIILIAAAFLCGIIAMLIEIINHKNNQ